MRNKFRILFLVLSACVCMGADATTSMVRRLMKLPPFERAVLIMESFP